MIKLYNLENYKKIKWKNFKEKRVQILIKSKVQIHFFFAKNLPKFPVMFHLMYLIKLST